MFITVDLGKPSRILNVMLHPTPNSVLFWDMVVLNGYLIINLIGRLGNPGGGAQERAPSGLDQGHHLPVHPLGGVHPHRDRLPVCRSARPRLLAHRHHGPALFGLGLCRRPRGADPAGLSGQEAHPLRRGREAFETLAKIVCYAIILHIFFFLLEVFTVAYSAIPSHTSHLAYLYFGLHGHNMLVPWVWTALACGFTAIVLLVNPRTRQNPKILPFACVLVFICTWIDKGMAMIAGGFVPNPLHEITEYAPTGLELMITFGVYATGILILTILYKVALGVKEEEEAA